MKRVNVAPADNPRKLRSGHTCHATGCDKRVPPKMFACRYHWFLLPLFMRNTIMLTYRDGQCDDWMPSRKYCEAAKAAVEWLAKKENREPDVRVYVHFMLAADIREEESHKAVAAAACRAIDTEIWDSLEKR